MFDTCAWWQNSFLKAVTPYRGLLRGLKAVGLLPLLARVLERDICRNTREEVNIYTYRTADYLLSTAQDYRKGYGGDQQHIWQATLGPDAVCFTTHPARVEGVTPNYWAGSGLLPRAAQVKNVTVVLYKIQKIPALYVPIRHLFTHAWLPADKFDKVVERDGWFFASKGQGYLALRSHNPAVWRGDAAREAGLSEPVRLAVAARTSEEDLSRELIADGAQNVWICQMGRLAEDGEFADFVEKICAAELAFDGLTVRYRAPGLGLVRFGWDGPLTLDGAEVPLRDYPRYGNPYVQAEFDPREVRVRAGDEELGLRIVDEVFSR
jgi:hypothetical protein